MDLDQLKEIASVLKDLGATGLFAIFIVFYFKDRAEDRRAQRSMECKYSSPSKPSEFGDG